MKQTESKLLEALQAADLSRRQSMLFGAPSEIERARNIALYLGMMVGLAFALGIAGERSDLVNAMISNFENLSVEQRDAIRVLTPDE